MIVLPCKDGELSLSLETVEALKKVYIGLDIETELAKMHLWLLRKPSSRWKVRTAMIGIRRWLNKEYSKQVKGSKSSLGQKRAAVAAAMFRTENTLRGVELNGNIIEYKPRSSRG